MSRTPGARRLVLAVAAVAVAGLVPAGPAGAVNPTTTTTRPPSTPTPAPATTVPGQRAAAEQQVDVLQASLEDVQARIASVDGRLAEETRRLELSRAAVQVSLERAAAAGGRAATSRAAAGEARAAARQYAVEAFIRPPVQDSLAVLSLPSADDAQYGTRVLQTVADERREVLDRMTEAEATATAEQAAADAAASAATAQARQAEAQVADLESARTEQVQLASSLDDRLDVALSEAAALREIDLEAARELAERELALRRSAAPTPAPATPATVPPATRPGGQAPVAAARPTPPATTAPPRTSTPIPSAPPPPTSTSGVVTRDQVVSVRGILVHRSIASQTEALLAAASAAGVPLGGSGWRDTSRQIQLRMQHCGTTPYAIYDMPADQCVPPVARPGRSMHERGLAIDFVVGGDLIRTRSAPAYQWLAANASRFGFFNLPSEPWHWSTTGS